MKVLKTASTFAFIIFVFKWNISQTFTHRLKKEETKTTNQNRQCIFDVCSCQRIYQAGSLVLKLDCSAKRIKKLDIFSHRHQTEKWSSYLENTTDSELYLQYATNLSSVLQRVEFNLRMNSLQTIRNEFHDFDKHTAENIDTLDLSYNRIKQIATNALVPLRRLRKLSLRYNRITTIPDLSTLSSLRIVDFRNNFFLKIVPGHYLPRFLTHLYLANTPLNHISRDLLQGQSSMKVLDISSGLATQMRHRTIAHDAFDDLHNLAVLDMSFTNWWKHTFSVKNFKYLCSLKTLKARGCYLRSFHLFTNETRCASRTLEEIDLSGNSLNTTNFTIGNFPKLQRLYLNYTTMKYLPKDALQNMPLLQELHISGVKLHTSSIHSLDNNPTIRYLDLSHNRLLKLPVLSPTLNAINVGGNTLDTIQRRVFFRANSLSTLDLSDQQISSIEEHSFLDNLTNQTKKLSHLNLRGNNIQNVSYNQLVGLENLVELNLDGNTIQYLERLPLPKLEILKLSNNMLQEINAETFNNMPYLKHLDMSRNKIFYVEASTGFHALQHLNLNQNNLTLVTSIPSMANLQYLSLDYNNITGITRHALGNCCLSLRILKAAHNNINTISSGSFQYLSNLTELDISFNEIDFSSHQTFQDLQDLEKLKLTNGKQKAFLNVPLRNLKRLDFYKNKLASLGNIRISELTPGIEYLDLSSNDITYIQPGLLDGLVHLKIINLKYNNFQCPCNDDDNNMYANAYHYAKEWLVTFAHSEQADKSMLMLQEIEADKINPVPAYFCTKEDSEMMPFFNEPCQQDAIDIFKNFLKVTNLEGYEDYLSTLINGTTTDEDGSSQDYDYGNYEDY